MHKNMQGNVCMYTSVYLWAHLLKHRGDFCMNCSLRTGLMESDRREAGQVRRNNSFDLLRAAQPDLCVGRRILREDQECWSTQVTS